MNQHPNSAPTIHNFPQQITPFVGRQQELDELTNLLADPACQLLTLVGPGGMGKTRLAMAAAMAQVHKAGAYFIPLQPVATTADLLPAIANTLGLSLSGHISPVEQITHFLQDKAFLLLLDNFEHLLSAADQLPPLLAGAPSVQWLVTSREILSLYEEWIFAVDGLSLPLQAVSNRSPAMGAEDGASLEGQTEIADALKLFAWRAQRMRPDFSLTQESEGVAQICHLVGGMPLALELAAAWIRAMDCQTIASEIQHSIDFLSTGLRNVPQRHRSIQAVFDQSWQMLTGEEQQIYARLSVFAGGFRRDAAELVAGASIMALTAFVDCSLLHRGPDERYQIHPLLRQYAAGQLAQSPQLQRETQHTHCAWFAQFLSDCTPDLYQAGQVELVTEIAVELDNIRAAWAWAAQEQRLADLAQMVSPLMFYFQLQSRYLDGMQLFETVLSMLTSMTHEQQRDRQFYELQVLALPQAAWFALRLGQIERVRALCVQCLEIYQNNDLLFTLPGGHTNDPGLQMGIVATIDGDYEQADSLLHDVLQRNPTPQNQSGNRQTAFRQLAVIALDQGDLDGAQAYAQQAFAAAEAVQDRWFMAYCHLVLGDVAQRRTHTAIARHHFQVAHDLRALFTDKEGMAVALARMGDLELASGAAAAAQVLFDRSIALYSQIHDPGGLATAHLGAARSAVVMGAHGTACQHLDHALSATTEIALVTLQLTILVEVADLLSAHGRSEAAEMVWATVAQHPSASHELRQRTATIAPVSPNLASDLAIDLTAAVFLAQQELDILAMQFADQRSPSATAHTPASVPPQSPATSSTAPTTLPPGTDAATSQRANQALPEPLTPRELEVLHLMAQGLTNQAIADELIIVLGTVKAHTNNIYGKLGVNNRTHAVARARELQILGMSGRLH